MRWLLIVGILPVILLTGGRVCAQTPEITVATWSGFYRRAHEETVFKAFTQNTGIGVRIVNGNGDLSPLADTGRPPPWHAIDVERTALDQGCADGKLEKLDHAALLGKAGTDDFLPGLLHPCGIGSLLWSEVIAYDATFFADNPPMTPADFFDPVRFEGKRGLPASAEGALELALLADGVPPAQVYDLLRQPAGRDRAFAKLRDLSGAVEFWHDGAEAERFLNEGRVVMTTAYAGRLLRARTGARRSVGLIWTHQLWRASYWAIPARLNNRANAERFVSFATDPEQLAGLARLLWFGPARRSALDRVPDDRHADLPSAPAHFQDGLQVDPAFWAEFGDGVNERYAAWRAANR